MTKPSLPLAALALALALPLSAHAHKMWLLPSATNVAGADPWITVDAAISNDLFHADHHPAALENLVITRPDGSTARAEHAATGKYRSVFDLHLTQPGTWKLALVNQGLFARYELDGQKKRWRGRPQDLATALPAGARNVTVIQADSRVETFVSNGKPSSGALAPGGHGLELEPVTHVTDLMAGEPASFRLLLDGRPAAGVEVTAIAGATRYRNDPQELHATTGSDGRFSLTWPYAGMYWINASVEDDRTNVKQATQRRAAYTATLEVLPE